MSKSKLNLKDLPINNRVFPRTAPRPFFEFNATPKKTWEYIKDTVQITADDTVFNGVRFSFRSDKNFIYDKMNDDAVDTIYNKIVQQAILYLLEMWLYGRLIIWDIDAVFKSLLFCEKKRILFQLEPALRIDCFLHFEIFIRKKSPNKTVLCVKIHNPFNEKTYIDLLDMPEKQYTSKQCKIILDELPKIIDNIEFHYDDVKAKTIAEYNRRNQAFQSALKGECDE